MIGTLLLVWLVGAMVTYAADGLLNWSDEDQEFCFWWSLFWPILWGGSIIFGIPGIIRNRLTKVRKEREARKEEARRYRVAKIKESEALQKKAEQELSEYMSELEETNKQKRSSL